MKATIKNITASPRAFFLDAKLKVLNPGEELQGDFDDGLLQSLKNTGFSVDHKGELKLADPKPVKADTKAAKDEAAAIINSARETAEKIIADAKAEADKILAEAEELAKADK